METIMAHTVNMDMRNRVVLSVLEEQECKACIRQTENHGINIMILH